MGIVETFQTECIIVREIGQFQGSYCVQGIVKCWKYKRNWTDPLSFKWVTHNYTSNCHTVRLELVWGFAQIPVKALTESDKEGLGEAFKFMQSCWPSCVSIQTSVTLVLLGVGPGEQ